MRYLSCLALLVVAATSGCTPATSPGPAAVGSADAGGLKVTAPATAPATASLAGDTEIYPPDVGETASPAVDGGEPEVPPFGDTRMKQPWPRIPSGPPTPPPRRPPFDLEVWLKEHGVSGVPRGLPCWYKQPIAELPPEQLYRCECESASFPGREVLNCWYRDESTLQEQAPILSHSTFFVVHQGRLVLALDLPVSSMLDVDCPIATREYCMMRIDYEIMDDGLVASDEHNKCGRALPALRAHVAAGQARRQQLQRAELICNAVGRYRWKGARLVREVVGPPGRSESSSVPR